MEAAAEHVLTPGAQWGITGIAMALLALLTWGAKAFLSYVKSNSDNLVRMSEKHIMATSKNSEVMGQLGQSIERQSTEMRELSNVVRSLPIKDT